MVGFVADPWWVIIYWEFFIIKDPIDMT
jgi:hypothetical protein